MCCVLAFADVVGGCELLLVGLFVVLLLVSLCRGVLIVVAALRCCWSSLNVVVVCW